MRKIALYGLFLSLFGSLSAMAADAPVTTVGNITNAVPGSPALTVPVTVTNFSNIGQLTLTLKFDTTRIRYITYANNPLLTHLAVAYTRPATGSTTGKLIITWTDSSNLTLPNGSVLADLTFSYVSGTGLLTWGYSYGMVCQYKRFVSGIASSLNDTPKYLFYYNGGISNRGAPVTFAPTLPMTAPGAAAVPVTVTGFTGIEALTLYLEYDPAILTYLNSFTKNVAFGSTFQVGTIAGSGGKMLLIIQWYGTPAINLGNGATICTLNFNYISATGAIGSLNWFDNGPSCEYADAGSALIDLPASYYYHPGVVGPPVVAAFTADKLTPLKNETVHFTDQTSGSPTSWTWSFDRPGVVFVNGTTATSRHPYVQFTDGGLYTVTLVAANSFFSDPEIKTGYIRAGSAGLWTGNTSTDWATPSNWDNYLAPDSFINVTIPPAASNWPVFTGDLTIGVHCSSLTLSGSASQMTVTGNLTLP